MTFNNVNSKDVLAFILGNFCVSEMITKIAS